MIVYLVAISDYTNIQLMRTFILLLFLIMSMQLIGQDRFVSHDYIPGNIPNYKPAFNEAYPAWAKMLYEEGINYFEIEESYSKWAVSNSGTFRDIQRYYKIWRKHAIPFVNDSGKIQLDAIDKFYETLALQHKYAPKTQDIKSPSLAGEWEFLGPKETFWLNESGSPEAPGPCPWQVNLYTFDVAESNLNTIYCGTETGFINKSIDNGINWNLLAQGYNFGGGITALAIDPLNEDIVYAVGGKQIHKTTDGGENWTPMLSVSDQFYADKITIDATNPSKIFAAGSSGVQMSVDAGNTWTNVSTLASFDVHIKPTSADTVYAITSFGGNFNVIISTDGGETFSNDSNFPSQIQEVSGGLLAVTPAAPDNLYVIMLSVNNTPLIYRGNMATGTWELLATGQTNELPLNNGQGFFDLILEVSPLDANLIFAGTTTLYKSTNGGSNFSIVGGYGGSFPIHPDIQAMKILHDGSSWVATDGGFTHSTDNFISVDNAVAKNKNLVGSDMWGFDQGWNEDLIVGGRYHNGNTAIAEFYQPKAIRMGGAESPTGWIMKGKSKHATFNDLGPGWILPESAESAPQGRFGFSKYPNMDEYGGRRGNMLFHPNYYETIYLGEGNGFWKSLDMGVSFELLHDFGNRIRFCQLAYNDPNIIYADIVNQGLFRSEDGGATWTAKPSLTDGSAGSAFWQGKLHFEISPYDANTIYACLQNGTWSADLGKVFKSVDGGDSWEDFTGSLNEFTKTLLVQPDADGKDILYLFTTNKNGNAAQCYIRRPTDTDWSIYGEKFPAGMAPNHALPFYRDSKIRVAGNAGIWENTLEEPNFQPIIQPWVERPFYDCMLDTIQFDDHSILNHENASWTWEIQPSPLYIDDKNKRNPKVVLGTPGSYDITITVLIDGASYSKSIENMVTTVECPSVEDCDNPGLLAKDSWKLEYVNSEEINYPGLATMAFDNDPETIWHTRWSTGSDTYPHEIQVDLGEAFDIHEFTYYPRQDGQNGWIKDYELYFSEDLDTWGDIDALGQFENSAAPKKLIFQTPKVGRYFKFVALSEINGNPWASASEIEIKGCYHQSPSSLELVKQQSLKGFPVPTQGLFAVPLPSDELFTYSIYSTTGQLMQNGQSIQGNETIQLDLSDYTTGMYIIKLREQSGSSYFIKAVKE